MTHAISLSILIMIGANESIYGSSDSLPENKKDKIYYLATHFRKARSTRKLLVCTRRALQSMIRKSVNIDHRCSYHVKISDRFSDSNISPFYTVGILGLSQFSVHELSLSVDRVFVSLKRTISITSDLLGITHRRCGYWEDGLVC
jgi:hypothetical protein